jgi:hypothetical protein
VVEMRYDVCCLFGILQVHDYFQRAVSSAEAQHAGRQGVYHVNSIARVAGQRAACKWQPSRFQLQAKIDKMNAQSADAETGRGGISAVMSAKASSKLMLNKVRASAKL